MQTKLTNTRQTLNVFSVGRSECHLFEAVLDRDLWLCTNTRAVRQIVSRCLVMTTPVKETLLLQTSTPDKK